MIVASSLVEEKIREYCKRYIEEEVKRQLDARRLKTRLFNALKRIFNFTV